MYILLASVPVRDCPAREKSTEDNGCVVPTPIKRVDIEPPTSSWFPSVLVVFIPTSPFAATKNLWVALEFIVSGNDGSFKIPIAFALSVLNVEIPAT